VESLILLKVIVEEKNNCKERDAEANVTNISGMSEPKERF
jgi:hypothetical protein